MVRPSQENEAEKLGIVWSGFRNHILSILLYSNGQPSQMSSLLQGGEIQSPSIDESNVNVTLQADDVGCDILLYPSLESHMKEVKTNYFSCLRMLPFLTRH